MKEHERDAAHLLDMLSAARELKEMLGDHDLVAFLENRMLVRAVERMSEIIGEAAGRVSDTFRQAHPEIHWREIIGQRNILAHEYGRIDYELLYRTAVEDVPLLIEQLEALLPPWVSRDRDHYGHRSEMLENKGVESFFLMRMSAI